MKLDSMIDGINTVSMVEVTFPDRPVLLIANIDHPIAATHTTVIEKSR